MAGRHQNCLLLAGAIIVCMPVSVRAQRAAPSAIAAITTARTEGRLETTRFAFDRMQTSERRHGGESDSLRTGTDAAPWGALVGAVLGGAYGALLGENCSELHNDAPCVRTVVIASATVGAVLGYGAGRVIQMGKDHDARRARAAERDSTASTPRPSHP